MTAKIINTFEVVECNKAMKAEGINAKLHLRDACGAQSFWIEGAEKEFEEARDFVSSYFEGRIDVKIIS